MKIGIMTYWNVGNNYGTVLQCWALQRFLKKNGHTPFLIRYQYNAGKNLLRSLCKMMNPRKAWNVLRNKIFSVFFEDKKFAAEQKEVFQDFLANELEVSKLQYGSYAELKNNPPAADAYIAGSDQIWNFYQNKLHVVRDHINAFFLNFGNDKTRRISYAASFGGDSFKQEYSSEITSLLAQFTAVSVREKRGTDICSQYGRTDAAHVLDPTLLLTADDYREFYRSKSVGLPAKKYAFVYLLENESTVSLDEIAAWAKKNDLEIVYIPGQGCRKNTPVAKSALSVHEWLALLDNAQCVITNSFHCCVFSIIFQKSFAFNRQTGKFASQNVRIDNLLSMFGIPERDFDKIGDPASVSIDYNKAGDLLQDYLTQSQNFLNSSLK